MIAAVLLLSKPALMLATTISLPGPFEVSRAPGVGDLYYVHARAADLATIFKVDVATGARATLTTRRVGHWNEGYREVRLNPSGLLYEITYDRSTKDVATEIRYTDLASGTSVTQVVPPGDMVDWLRLRTQDFLGPCVPVGNYIRPDGKSIRVQWDSPEGRYGFVYRRYPHHDSRDPRIEFEPGTWNEIPPRKDNAIRYGAEGGLTGNKHAQPNISFWQYDQMAGPTTGGWDAYDADERDLPWGGCALEQHEGRWYGQPSSGPGIVSMDLGFKRNLWARKELELGSRRVAGNPVIPYRNGSWIGDYLVATYDTGKARAVLLLDGNSGRTLFKLPIGPQDHLLAITSTYLLIERKSPCSLQRWNLIGTRSG
jgi:hypothetical protein